MPAPPYVRMQRCCAATLCFVRPLQHLLAATACGLVHARSCFLCFRVTCHGGLHHWSPRLYPNIFLARSALAIGNHALSLNWI